MICKLPNSQNSKIIQLCSKHREYVRAKIGTHIHNAEHVIYGVTYLLIGATHLEVLYYAFGTFVLFAIVYGKE